MITTKNKTDDALFFEFLILKGLKEHGKENDERYVSRAKHEFDRMIGKKYLSYFLAVWEYVKWAKKNKIRVGPGRGSCGGSIISMLLDISEPDPIKHNLLFTRFISEIRKDAPDIDLDFADARRKEIFEHLSKTYGEKNTAHVVTYSRFHAKGVMRDIGRIFDIPRGEVEKICGMVIERSGGDARASFGLADTFAEFDEAKKFKEKYPKAADIAGRLEGHIRHKGIHAAAMIASEQPIYKQVPINKVNGKIVTEWEKQSCEDMKLVKFDILGLKTLTLIQDCVDSADCKLPKTFEDKKVYEYVFQDNNFVGVFQFTGTGMQKFSSKLKINTFNELYDATTLFRPGCVSGDTKVLKNSYFNSEKFLETKIKNLTKHKQIKVLGKDGSEKSAFAFSTGKKELFRLETEDGNFIDASSEHKFWTENGWKKLSELKEEMEIFRCEPEENIDYIECKICKKRFKYIGSNHLKIHKINVEKYRKLFPNCRILTFDFEKQLIEKIEDGGKTL